MDTGDRSVHIGSGNSGVVITGNSNIVQVARGRADGGVPVARQQLAHGLHTEAIETLKVASGTDPDDPEIYLLSAVATLHGRRPFLCPLADIRTAERLIRTALSLENRAIFHYFLAYLALDYYEKKCLHAPVPWQSSLAAAVGAGVTGSEIGSLFELLGVPDPLRDLTGN